MTRRRRAGERGRAFTVIADEIGRLATATQRETGGVVHTILALRDLSGELEADGKRQDELRERSPRPCGTRTTILRGRREVSRGASSPVYVSGTRVATVVLMENLAER